MTPEEVGLMGDQECLYFLRGIDPFRVPKFKYETHHNYQYTGDASVDNLYDFRPPALSQEEKDIISDSSQMLFSSEVDNKNNALPLNTSNKAGYISSDSSYIDEYLKKMQQSSSGINIGPADVESAGISGDDIMNRRSNSTLSSASSKTTEKSSRVISKKYESIINGGTNDENVSKKVFDDMNENDIFSAAIALQESLVLNSFLDDDDDDDIIEENMFSSSKPVSTSNQ